MTRNATVIACFLACLASVGVACGTVTPVAYGAGEMTPGVGATSIVSTLTALLTGGGGLFALLKNGGASGAIKTITDIATPLIGGKFDAASITEDAALVVIAGCRVRKGDTEGLRMVGELAKRVLAPPADPNAPKPITKPTQEILADLLQAAKDEATKLLQKGTV